MKTVKNDKTFSYSSKRQSKYPENQATAINPTSSSGNSSTSVHEKSAFSSK